MVIARVRGDFFPPLERRERVVADLYLTHAAPRGPAADAGVRGMRRRMTIPDLAGAQAILPIVVMIGMAPSWVASSS